MKKADVIFIIFVICALCIVWLLPESPKVNTGNTPEVKTEAKIKEIDKNIARANDMAMGIIISRLKSIEFISRNNKAIAKEAKKLRIEAEALRKEIREIKTDEQRIVALEKAKEFSTRHDPFIERFTEICKEMKKRREKSESAEIKIQKTKSSLCFERIYKDIVLGGGRTANCPFLFSQICYNTGMQNKKIIQYILIALAITISFFAFWSVDRALRIPDASVWAAPTFWFSLLFILLCLNITLIKDKKIIYLSLFASLLASLIFSPNFWQFLVILFGWLLLLAAWARIRGDIEYGKKIKLWRSLRFGKAYIYFALALVISSQYYFSTKDWLAQKLIPNFNLGGVTDALAPKILSAVSPGLPASVDSEMTVDQFIVQMQKNQMDQAGYSPEKLAKLPPEQRAAMQKQIDAEANGDQNTALEESRKKFADLSGRTITGSEKISDVLSGIINSKINNLLNPGNISADTLPIAAPIATLILFLTVASLGWLLVIFLVPITAGIFWILVQAKVVLISKIQTEVEIIE